MSGEDAGIVRSVSAREEAMNGEFTAELGEDGSLVVPQELHARLRMHGVRVVRVTVAPAGADRVLLARRGVDGEEISRVAETQRVPVVVAESMLLVEGGALGRHEFEAQLRALASSSSFNS